MKHAKILTALGLALGVAVAATTTASAAKRPMGVRSSDRDAAHIVTRHPGRDDFGPRDNDSWRGADRGSHWRPKYSTDPGRDWLPPSWLNDQAFNGTYAATCQYSRDKWRQTGRRYWHNRYEACLEG